MAKTTVGAADGDEPLDPELTARMNEAFAALPPNLGLPELARLQACIDASLAAFTPKIDTLAFMPKIDTSAFLSKIDTSAFLSPIDTSAFLSKIDTSAFLSPIDTSAFLSKIDTSAFMPMLHVAIAAAAPKLDLSELDGFARVAEGLATRVSTDALAGLAASVEQVIPALPLDDFASLLDPEIIQWAVSLNFDHDLTSDEGEDGAYGGVETDEDRQEHLREHLEQVAHWLYTSAAQLRAGVLRLNTTVDSLNENIDRYEKLAVHLFKLYLAITFIKHFL